MSVNPHIHRTGARARSAMIIRNEYQNHFGIQYYLIVEGTSDEHFFENILDCSKCKVINLGGKSEVKDFIVKQNILHKKGYLGIVDADFEHIDGYENKVDNLIITDVHDIEMLILSSNPSMRKIYSELTDNMKIEKFEEKNSRSFLECVMGAAYEMGLLTMVMKKPQYCVDMKGLFYSDIVDANFIVNIDVLINRVKKRHHFLSDIKNEIELLRKKKFDKYQVCCGHDVTELLALSFMSSEHEGLGYGNNRVVTKERIEEMLRIIYDFEHFLTTRMYSEILKWESTNTCILDRKIIKVA